MVVVQKMEMDKLRKPDKAVLPASQSVQKNMKMTHLRISKCKMHKLPQSPFTGGTF